MATLDATPGGLDLGMLKLIALLLFFGFFVVVLLRVALADPERYRRAARIPLDEVSAPDASGRPNHE